MPGKLELRDDNGCFVCGKENPLGLHLEFAFEGNEYVTYFTPRREHQGWIGIVHGGLVSTVLDEVMVRGTWELGHRTATAEITVRLKKPAPIGMPIRFAARIEKENSRLMEASAKATLNGELIAEATGRMIKVASNDR